MIKYFYLTNHHDLLREFCLGFFSRYNNNLFFDDFLILVPGYIELVQINQIIKSEIKDNVFLPETISISNFLERETNFSELELRRKISQIEFLQNNLQQDSQYDLFRQGHTKFNLKNITTLADYISDHNENNLSIEFSNKNMVFIDMIKQNFKHKFTKNNQLELLNERIKHKHLIILRNPILNHQEKALNNLIKEHHLKTDIVNYREFYQEDYNAEIWQQNNQQISKQSKQFNINTEDSEISQLESLTHILNNKIKKKESSIIIIDDHKLRKKTEQYLSRRLGVKTNNDSDKLLFLNVIALLSAEISFDIFSKKTNLASQQLQKISEIYQAIIIKKEFDCKYLVKIITILESNFNNDFYIKIKQISVSLTNSKIIINQTDLKILFDYILFKQKRRKLSHSYIIITDSKHLFYLNKQNIIFLNFSKQNVINHFKHNIKTEILDKLCKSFLQNNKILLSFLSKNRNQTELNYINKNLGITKVRKYYFSPNIRQYKQINNYVLPNEKSRIHNFSITQIEKLQKNPYSVYCQNVLHLYPRFLNKEEIIPIIFGNALHFALQQFCRNFAIISQANYKKYLVKQFSYYIDKNYSVKYTKILSQKFKSLVDNIIKYEESSRVKYSEYFAEIKTEHKFSELNNISLFGYIDRLNIEENAYEIVDYKTGTLPSLSKINNGLNSQILIANLLLNKNISLANKFSIKYLRFNSDNIVEMKCEEKKDIASDLINLISKYQNKNSKIYILPDQNIKVIDGYKHICRQ